jgi:hypothetical protein
MENGMKVVMFTLLAVYIFTGTVNAESMTMLNLKPGRNEVVLTVSNKWMYDIKASIHLDSKAIPSWLDIDMENPVISVSENSTLPARVKLFLNVLENAPREITEIPYHLQDATGNRWNNSLHVMVMNQEGERAIIDYDLGENFPNPFNATPTISYSIAYGNTVSLKVYNTLGQEVKTLINEFKQPGHYTIQWDGTNNRNQNVSTGLYFYRLTAGSFIKTRKMTYVE